MNMNHIHHLLNVGQLAVQLHILQNEAKQAKAVYREKLKESGEEFRGLHPHDTAFAEVIEFTKDEFKAYTDARRTAYNAQRRLDTACRKVAGVAA